MNIQQTVEEGNASIRAMMAAGDADPRALAIAVEMNQLYCDYLDSLLDSDLSVDIAVTVKVDGKCVKFRNIGDVSSWLTSK